MNTVTYKNITCKEALHKLKPGRLPFEWDLNVFRGCEHGCAYCYALYSHQYIQDNEFYSSIHVKTNIAERLEYVLFSHKWARQRINLGGVTDSYQPAEAIYKYMPDIWKLLIKYKTPAVISTKSDLILRDYDLIDELSRVAQVNIACTITTADDEQKMLLEPKGSMVANRFKVLKEFKNTKATVGWHNMPLIPYLTDSKENLTALFEMAKEANVDYCLPGTLYLRSLTRKHFFNFLQNTYPEKYAPIKLLYDNKDSKSNYKQGIYKLLKQLFDKYKIKMYS